MRLSVLALSLTLGLLPLTAQRPDRPAESPRLGLKLSDDQKKQVEALRAKQKEAIEAKRKALADAREAFRATARKPDATIESLRPLHQALADKQFDLMQTQRAQRLAIRELLTPEQRERTERMRGRQEGMRMGRGREMQGPGHEGMGRRFMEGREHGREVMQGPLAGRMAERLGLDEGQRKALKELQEKQQAEGQALRKKLQEAHQALAEAADKPSTPVEELKKLHATASDLQFQVLTAQRSHRQAMEKLLTPEQREKIKTAMERRGAQRPRR